MLRPSYRLFQTSFAILAFGVAWGCSEPASNLDSSTGSDDMVENLPKVDGLMAVNDTELFVKSMGEGPAVLVLHGGPGWDHGQLHPHLEPLAADVRLYSFDQRASGRSAVEGLDQSSMTVEQLVDDIEGLRQALHLEQVILMGHSFGGRLALQYALRYQENLAALVLISPTASSGAYLAQVNQTIQSRLTEEDKANRDRLLQLGAFSGEKPEEFEELMRLLTSANFHDREKSQRLTFFTGTDFNRRGELNQALMTSASPYDFSEELVKINVPTLFVRGQAEALPLEATALMHEKVAGSELVELPKCGHFSFVECPELLMPEIRSFLSRLSMIENGD